MSPAIPPAVAEFAVQQLADRQHPLVHPRARLLDALLSIADGVGAEVGYVGVHAGEDLHLAAAVAPEARAALAFDLGLTRRSVYGLAANQEQFTGTWRGATVALYGPVTS